MSTKPQLSGRLEFIDGLRGIAVLCMLVLHSAHGWLHPDFRSGPAWYWINSVGGMAAPLFFLLTGIAMGLRMDNRRRPGPRAELARGAGLVVLGYLLRVQMWQLDGAAIVEPPQLAAGVVLAFGYLLLYRGLSRFGQGEPAAVPLCLGAMASAVGLAAAHQVAPASVPNLLRFDVLQGLGVTAMVLTAVLTPFRTRRAQALATLALAGLILGLTPPLRAWVPGPLPAALAAPIAYWPNPQGGAPWAMFPLFPWAAYAAFGVLVGHRLGGQHPAVAALVILGGALAWLTSEDLPRVTELLAQHPALTQPVRVGYRLGLGLILLGAAATLARTGGFHQRRLVELGRASLWVYWLHLEFAFGAPSTPIHGMLSLGQWLPLLGVLTLAMLAVARARGWLRKRSDSGRLVEAGVPGTNVEQGA